MIICLWASVSPSSMVLKTLILLQASKRIMSNFQLMMNLCRLIQLLIDSEARNADGRRHVAQLTRKMKYQLPLELVRTHCYHCFQWLKAMATTMCIAMHWMKKTQFQWQQVQGRMHCYPYSQWQKRKRCLNKKTSLC